MHKISKREILFLFIVILFIYSSNYGIFSSEIEQNDSVDYPETSPVYSTLIIRPNEDYMNPFPGWDTSPIYEKIDDAVTYPNSAGDSDYIVGNNVGNWCEVHMGDITLQPNQVITRIRIYARGSQIPFGLTYRSVDFYWRIGTGSYSVDKNLEFTGTSFSWLSTTYWDNLNLNQVDINNIHIRMEISGTDIGDPVQALSVMYAELTVKTNNPPSVNLIYPIGGETLFDTALVEWSYSDPEGDSISFDLSYRIDGGSWTSIITGLIDQTSYLWNFSSFTQTYSNVELLIEASDGDTGYANDTSDPFTIKVNRDPSVNLISPNGGETLREDTYILWTYSDLDQDTVFFNISYQINGGPWISIIKALENQTSYLWNASSFSQTYYNISLKIEAYDLYKGYSEDISEGNFTYRKNSNPTGNLVYPIGGEELRWKVLILWNYTDPDGDTLTFNLYYTVDGSEWQTIVTGLLNKTAFIWDLRSYDQTLINVTIRIEVDDGYGGVTEDFSVDPIVIKEYIPPLNPFIPLLILGVSIIASGAIVTGFIIKKNNKKTKSKYKIIPKKQTKIQANGKQLIIEGDILVKKNGKINEEDVISRLLLGDTLQKEIDGKEGYEVIKVLGKFNVTTIEDEFWKKIEQFDWQEDEKEEFIRDMLGLPPHCREEFLDDMLKKFGRT